MNITITGADDAVDPSDLLKLGEEFPFVEWAFLWSKKRAGTSRYPSLGWIERAQDALCFATHLCGEAARDAMSGTAMPEFALGGRIQINGYVPGRSLLSDHWGNLRFILQCRDEESLSAVAYDSSRMPQSYVLFDASCGCGKSSATWPRRPLGTRFGWAGGIGPDNVDEVISELHCADMSVMHDSHAWIDMESGVRTNDVFDLEKVRRVLEQVATLNERGRL